MGNGVASLRLPGALAALQPYWPVLAGLALVLVPTYVRLAGSLWTQDEHAHGPIILAVSLWLAWQQRDRIAAAVGRSNWALAAPLLAGGLATYIVGRSQEVLVLEVGSHLLILAGAAAALGGRAMLRATAVPILFLAFMVPLPGVIVDALTAPLKQFASAIAEQLLYSLGYPIARTGVVLSIGRYQLLVADACSGLHSMYSLLALSLLYVYLMRHPSRWRNAILLAAALPIALAANVVRVIILVLVTYHFGDEAGQGFVHGFAGMALFLIALALLMFVDTLLGLVGRLAPRRTAA
jgi:exosortase B